MASGTGNLPNDGMSFTPFDPLPASQLNDIVENVEALADGSGIGDGAITPLQRSGGYKEIDIPASTFSTTGIKSITGVGFKPKKVTFRLMPTDSTSAQVFWAEGYMDETGGQNLACFVISNTGAGAVRRSTASYAFGYPTNATTLAYLVRFSYVSMDDDGFTVNCDIAGAGFDVVAMCEG